MRVFVTGGTGLIGTRLIRWLRERRDDVVLLTRRAGAARERFGTDCTVVEGDPMHPGGWMDAVRDCDGVINLAGENISAHRWNESFKALIRDSRIKSTDNVVQVLTRAPTTGAGAPKVLVNASAIAYYGATGDEELPEDSPAGDDFLAQVCVEWERAARAAESSGVRVTRVRIGVVLDREGGALTKMLTPFKLGVGGPIGSGRHWMSWIHHDDIVGILLLALDNANASGAMNGTAPNPVTNYEFTKALGRALHRPTIFPIPRFALRLRFGEVADVIASGQRVIPKRAMALGYQFKFPAIDAALTNVLG